VGVGDQMAALAEVMVLVGDMGSVEEKQRTELNFC
jgi:hypothetical protein